MGETPERYYCKICKEGAVDKAALIDHLRQEHGIPEVLSFAAGIIITEDDRDVEAERLPEVERSARVGRNRA